VCSGVPPEFNDFLPKDSDEYKRLKASQEAGAAGAMAGLSVGGQAGEGGEGGGAAKAAAAPAAEKKSGKKKKSTPEVSGISPSLAPPNHILALKSSRYGVNE
jgi:hypothetical protein